MERKKIFDIKVLILVMLIMSLTLLVSGITYSLYQKLVEGTTSNVISTGKVYFTYTEGDFETNGIKVENAYPVSDAVGKSQMGNNNYFDFAVNGETTVGDINYEIVVLKEYISTLQDNHVKIYLTEVSGYNEVPCDLALNNGVVKTYAELQSSTKQDGKIIYQGTIKNNSVNYQKNFRLRMWISDNIGQTDDIYAKRFSVKVNVLGVQ